jgi:hypothetical protein
MVPEGHEEFQDPEARRRSCDGQAVILGRRPRLDRSREPLRRLRRSRAPKLTSGSSLCCANSDGRRFGRRPPLSARVGTVLPTSDVSVRGRARRVRVVRHRGGAERIGLVTRRRRGRPGRMSRSPAGYISQTDSRNGAQHDHGRGKRQVSLEVARAVNRESGETAYGAASEAV